MTRKYLPLSVPPWGDPGPGCDCVPWPGSGLGVGVILGDGDGDGDVRGVGCGAGLAWAAELGCGEGGGVNDGPPGSLTPGGAERPSLESPGLSVRSASGWWSVAPVPLGLTVKAPTGPPSGPALLATA